MTLTEACIKRPVLAWMLMAAVVVLGVLALQRIGISYEPDSAEPELYVSVSWPNAAPEELERDVVEPVEDAMMQIEGIRHIYVWAGHGTAYFTLECGSERTIDALLQEVHNRLGDISFPAEVKHPQVERSSNNDDPIMWLSVSGTMPARQMADVIRYKIRERLKSIPGVSRVDTSGQPNRQIRLWLNQDRLQGQRLSVSDVVDSIRQAHVNAPAGSLRNADRTMDVHVQGELTHLDELRHLPLRNHGSAVTQLQDVALVEDGFADENTRDSLDGAPGRAIAVYKRQGANTVAVASQVRAALDDIERDLPPEMHLARLTDDSQHIRLAVHELLWEMAVAVALTALVCRLFLGTWGSTVNVLLAVPMSLLGAVAVIACCGFTLNNMTLLALTLAVGIVVDDAIMVLESIDRQHTSGVAPQAAEAARRGTRAIAFAALAATLSVVAIFLPVVFMEGPTKREFLEFGVTLSVAVLLSYLEAITLTPARCAQLLRARRTEHLPSATWVNLEGRYQRLLQWVSGRPRRVLLGGMVVGCMGLACFTLVRKQFYADDASNNVRFRVRAASGTSLDKTVEAVGSLEAMAMHHPDVEHVFTSVSSGFAYMFLVLRENHTSSTAEIEAMLQKQVRADPRLAVARRGGNTSLSFSLRGPEWDTLHRQGERFVSALRTSPDVLSAGVDIALSAPQLVVHPWRDRCSDAGVSMRQLSTTVASLLGGVKVGKYSLDGRRVDMVLRLLASERREPEDVQALWLRGNGDSPIPLGAVAQLEERASVEGIRRRDRERALDVLVSLQPGASSSATMDQVKALAKSLPEGYQLTLQERSQTAQEGEHTLLVALLLGVLFAYMILAAQLNSLTLPLCVLLVLPFSAAGAAMALWATHSPLGEASWIGLLLLFGLVKKNSIMLVDCAAHHERQGVTPAQAAVTAGLTRLRPIIMTTLATAAAMVPAACALGPGGAARQPMAIAILGGLLVSTLLCLIVVPAAYLVRWRTPR